MIRRRANHITSILYNQIQGVKKSYDFFFLSFLGSERKRTRETLILTLGRTRGGWGMDVLLPPTDKVFFEFLQDDFSPAPVVFGNCMHFPLGDKF